MEPRQNPELIGQADGERTLLESALSGRLAHAWLLSGPRGIGKATLAYRFARFLLAGKEAATAGLFGDAPNNLAIESSDPVFRRVASGGHPDLRTVTRSVNPKTGKMRSEIVVDDIREAIAFLHLTPAEGGWRIVIVDDEMNRNASNALLKVLEEPPSRAVLLLVSHAPGRLLATIRSRCRRLDIKALPTATVMELLAREMPELSEADRGILARLGDGSIGRALTLAEAGGVELYRDLLDVLISLPRLDAGGLHRFADKLARGGADGTFRVSTELLLIWLQRMLRLASTGSDSQGEILPGEADCMRRMSHAEPLSRWLAFIENMQRQFALVDALNLDRRQLWIGTVLGLQRMVAA
jgi:DNA polymerase III subunit delta'